MANSEIFFSQLDKNVSLADLIATYAPDLLAGALAYGLPGGSEEYLQTPDASGLLVDAGIKVVSDNQQINLKIPDVTDGDGRDLILEPSQTTDEATPDSALNYFDGFDTLGSGYTNQDIVTVVGGNNDAQVMLFVDENGIVFHAVIVDGGTDYKNDFGEGDNGNHFSVTGGSGTGLALWLGILPPRNGNTLIKGQNVYISNGSLGVADQTEPFTNADGLNIFAGSTQYQGQSQGRVDRAYYYPYTDEAGSGYVAGETAQIDAGNGLADIYIEEVDESGAIVSAYAYGFMDNLNHGLGYSVENNIPLTGGSGTGATVSIFGLDNTRDGGIYFSSGEQVAQSAYNYRGGATSQIYSSVDEIGFDTVCVYHDNANDGDGYAFTSNSAWVDDGQASNSREVRAYARNVNGYDDLYVQNNANDLFLNKARHISYEPDGVEAWVATDDTEIRPNDNVIEEVQEIIYGEGFETEKRAGVGKTIDVDLGLATLDLWATDEINFGTTEGGNPLMQIDVLADTDESPQWLVHNGELKRVKFDSAVLGKHALYVDESV